MPVIQAMVLRAGEAIGAMTECHSKREDFPGPERHPVATPQAAWTALRNRPMPSISHSITSPGCRVFGGTMA